MRFEEKALAVQNRYGKGYPSVSMQQLKWLKASHKSELEKIRDSVRAQLKPLRRRVSKIKTGCKLDNFCKEVEDVVKNCNGEMMNISKKIIGDAVGIVGEPPCAFTAVAKGSLARGEATPYSDLEFFFIIENKTDVTKEYFMNLAMNIYFLIGNLQETKLRYMNIKELHSWFDDQEMNGLKIDGLQRGAGNIPTGNGVTDRKNKYIDSPEELLEKFKLVFDNPDEETAIVGDDSAMLAFTREIYSFSGGLANNLLRNFVAKQERVRMKDARRQLTIEMLENDVEEYELNEATFTSDTTSETKSHVVEVKPKIYRFPSLVILDLCILYEVNAESSWKAVDLLYSRGNISDSHRRALYNLLAMASYVRLCTYLYHKSQNEFMVLPDPMSRAGTRNAGKPCYLVSRNIFRLVIIYMYSILDRIVPIKHLQSVIPLHALQDQGSEIAGELMR